MNESVAVQSGAELRELERQGKLRVRCAVFSRVVGYLTPIDGWNPGKRQEYSERVMFGAKPDFGVRESSAGGEDRDTE
jgi:hypothetical protein